MTGENPGRDASQIRQLPAHPNTYEVAASSAEALHRPAARAVERLGVGCRASRAAAFS
jgi:hypothetical protein